MSRSGADRHNDATERFSPRTSYRGKDMEVLVLARRFTIITLFAAIFAITFSAAVSRNAGGGAQSHFGANYTASIEPIRAVRP